MNRKRRGRVSGPRDRDPFSQCLRRLGITRREIQVARLKYFNHRTNDAVAQELEISPNTVKVHVRHIYHKLGARNRMELADAIDRELVASAKIRRRRRG